MSINVVRQAAKRVSILAGTVSAAGAVLIMRSTPAWAATGSGPIDSAKTLISDLKGMITSDLGALLGGALVIVAIVATLAARWRTAISAFLAGAVAWGFLPVIKENIIDQFKSFAGG